jgi:hypothetical protein
MAAFDQAVPLGVNSNLCDAVTGLWGGGEVERNLEFSFSWSPTRPVPAGLVQRVIFSSDRIPIIREAGRQMRERAPLPDFELHGPVVKLERPEGGPLGRVTVIGLVDDRQVRVTVELDDGAYHQAVQAHDQGRTLRILGTLTREGRGFLLRDPMGLAVERE